VALRSAPHGQREVTAAQLTLAGPGYGSAKSGQGHGSGTTSCSSSPHWYIAKTWHSLTCQRLQSATLAWTKTGTEQAAQSTRKVMGAADTAAHC